MRLIYRAAALAAAAFSLIALTACDPQRISELKEGVSTEADMRDRFGAPENVWEEPGGARTFEYNRQPAGQVNYMITIGPDGRMTALRQVLTPETFDRVSPVMRMDEVRRLLGKPAKTAHYALKNETAVDWRFADGSPSPKVFTVVHGPDLRVVRTQTGDDLDAPEFKGGGK
eukprot:gene41066-50815_t